MTWSFARGTALTDLHVRRRPHDVGYELIVSHPNGVRDVEQFRHPTALIDAALQLQDDLIQQGWRPREPRWFG